MLNFDINTTDTQKQQLYHGDIILAHNKPIICLTLHLTVAISTKSQPMAIIQVRVFKFVNDNSNSTNLKVNLLYKT